MKPFGCMGCTGVLGSRMKMGACQLGLNSCHPSRLLRRAELWVSLGGQGHHVLRQGRCPVPGLQEEKPEPTMSVLRLSLSRDDLLIDSWRFTQWTESNLGHCPVFN